MCFLLSFLLHYTLTTLVSFLPSLLLTQLHKAPMRPRHTKNVKHERRVLADIALLLPKATTTNVIAFAAAIAATFTNANATIDYVVTAAPIATANVASATVVVTTISTVAVVPVAAVTTVTA